MNDRQEVPNDKKKPNILVRLLAFLVTLALVFGAVTLVVYRDRLNFDVIRRYFTYRSLERNDSGQAESFAHEGSTRDIFVSAGENLLVCSTTGVRLFSGSGTQYANEQIVMEQPVAMAAGEWSLAYDAGGKSLYLFQDKEKVFSLGADSGKTILSARVNENGWLAVVTQAASYKGSVTVYNPQQQPVIQLNRSSGFVMDALVTEDGKYLATVTVSQSGASFSSSLDLYRLDRTEEETEPDVSASLDGSVILDLREQSGALWALGDTGVFAVSLAEKNLGERKGAYSYPDQYLKEFSLEGDGYAALLLGKYRAGTQAQLVVTDESGEVTGTLDIGEQVLSLSAAGRYIAVLTADRLDIYTSDLRLYDSLSGTQNAQKVLMRADGTAMLIGAKTARLYIPG
ncbi:MAG: DUF5711 family protein [Pseudoflavonifractor capillosus]|uniref:DUF5711 family protein n=1 Tax=Pseudoflavonifractor capillosus TaxID=106588 RepID=UPI0023F62BCE|nr:DUF5711 family protein [Pseudoflavonifractor capillosus]MCI5927925.1 DUF5711 family protein [Pseudoflavonifractor capillosus]MDY4662018.1 DUF5711 family protein [Pseudoflavonifractor capillosus]